MNRDELKKLVLEKLIEVAPDIESDALDPSVNFRDQYDFDSMDFLHFVIAVHKATGVEIPEIDYPKLANLEGCINYLVAKNR